MNANIWYGVRFQITLEYFLQQEKDYNKSVQTINLWYNIIKTNCIKIEVRKET